MNSALKTLIKRIQDEYSDFQSITMHGFRHSFATRCIESGMAPQTVKAILGHSKLSMTMDLYAHVLPDTKRQEMEKISSLYKSDAV